MSSFAKLKKIMTEGADFLLICHEHPDGDSIGALLALGESLEQAGKEVTMISKDPVPDVFKFLHHSEKIGGDFLLGNHQIIVILDCGDLRRTGFADRLSGAKSKKLPIINIDHHPKNDIWKIAAINYVDDKAASACELIYRLSLGLGWQITPSVATSLLTGIFTDTGGFQHNNTSKEVLEAFSDLLHRGAKLKTISANIANSHSVAMLKLWGIALDRLRVNRDMGLVYSILTTQDIKKVGAKEYEVSGLVNLINAIPESRIALLLYEAADGKIKGSLRTESDNIDLSKLAVFLGGGGHKRASGFSLLGQLKNQGNSWQIA